MKYKIGIFVRPIEFGKSGSGFHLRNLLKSISNLPHDFEIHLLYSRDVNLDDFDHFKKTKISRNIFKAVLFLRKQNFDLLHYSPLTVFSPIYFLSNVKKVATIHGCAPLFLPEFYSKLVYFHEKYIRNILLNKLDAVFTVSNTTKNFLISNNNVSSSKIFLTYNAVTNDFTSAPNFPLNISTYKDRKYIFHISRFSERKNPWLILNAFLKFSKLYNHDLIIAGTGWDNPLVVSFIESNNLKDRIIILGFVDHLTLISLYRNAVLFVFPSLYEGFGMPVLEAMATGCPVITSDRFALPEIADDCAILLDDLYNSDKLLNEMIELISNEDLRNSLIDKGLKRVLDFSWDNSALTVLSVYKKLLSSHL